MFISYSSKDREFAIRLKQDLELDGIDAWFDDNELEIGEGLTTSLALGVQACSCLVVVISRSSVQSTWVMREIELGLQAERGKSRRFVLPAILDGSPLPEVLGDRIGANFTESYDKGYAQLLRVLLPDLPVLPPSHPLWLERISFSSATQYLRRTHVPHRLLLLAERLGLLMLDEATFRLSCNEDSVRRLVECCCHAQVGTVAELDLTLRGVEKYTERFLTRLRMEDEDRGFDVPFVVHLSVILARRASFSRTYLEDSGWNRAFADRVLRIIDDVMRLPFDASIAAPRTRGWRFLHQELLPIAWGTFFRRFLRGESTFLSGIWKDIPEEGDQSSEGVSVSWGDDEDNGLVLIQLPSPTLDGVPWYIAIAFGCDEVVNDNRVLSLERRIDGGGTPSLAWREWGESGTHVERGASSAETGDQVARELDDLLRAPGRP